MNTTIKRSNGQYIYPDLITDERKELKNVIIKKESNKKFVWIYTITYSETVLEDDTNEEYNPMLLCEYFNSLEDLQKDLNDQIKEGISVYTGRILETEGEKPLIDALKQMKEKINKVGKLWELFVRHKSWLICVNKIGIKC